MPERLRSGSLGPWRAAEGTFGGNGPRDLLKWLGRRTTTQEGKNKLSNSKFIFILVGPRIEKEQKQSDFNQKVKKK